MPMNAHMRGKAREFKGAVSPQGREIRAASGRGRRFEHFEYFTFHEASSGSIPIPHEPCLETLPALGLRPRLMAQVLSSGLGAGTIHTSSKKNSLVFDPEWDDN